ncbi:MAG TPA: FMN-dependent NADH-azoreductase [Rhizomicrobium sp.]|nr:FMN-dependent NADH-azoreductase [Rhizomicrobium sp.]
MKNMLYVTASLSGPNSKSGLIGGEFLAAWQEANGPAHIVHRDLGAGSIPHLTGEYLKAWTTAPERRSDREHALVRESDPLIEEVEAAEVIVIAAPMYNFAIPSTLKAWIDHITRAGRTFRYTAEGKPEGLLRNKKVFVIAARGGIYTGDSPVKALDFQEPYLRTILGFNGLTDVTIIYVEGQLMGPGASTAGLAHAREAMGEIATLAQAAA